MTWNFLSIAKNHQRTAFDCGYPILNEYLKRYARQNHNKGIAKTIVAISASGGLKIDGYYTVSSSVIEFESLPESYYRTVRASGEIGIFAVRVDAIDLQAKEFYLKHEFIPFQDRELSLFLPIETIIEELS